MNDRPADLPTPATTSFRERLDPELERRVAALESDSEARVDFDAGSWLWLVLLGVIGPVALLVWGWFG
jgi:hypothetical protein